MNHEDAINSPTSGISFLVLDQILQRQNSGYYRKHFAGLSISHTPKLNVKIKNL